MVVGIALPGVVIATVAAWFVNRLQAVGEAEERTEATLAAVLADSESYARSLTASSPKRSADASWFGPVATPVSATPPPPGRGREIPVAGRGPAIRPHRVDKSVP
jgi:hypothetical protein